MIPWVLGAAFLTLLLSRLLRPRTAAWLVKLGWTRENYQGRVIPRGSGLLILVSVLPGLAFLARLHWPERPESAAAAAVFLFGALGLLDDAWGDRGVGGLRGHFGTLLRERRLTTGAAKALLGGLGSLCLGWWLAEGDALRTGAGPTLSRTLLAAGLVALGANALNLLDTRPCRCLALFGVGEGALLLAQATLPLKAVWSPLLVLAAALPLWPSERGRRSMLGDTGSNLLGAALGVHAAVTLPLVGQGLLLGALVWLHLYSERHSLNAGIARSAWLSRLDRAVQG